MAPKPISFSVFALILFSCLSLLVRASPVPIILPPTEGIALFRDVIAREALPELEILRREAAPALESNETTELLERSEDVEPGIPEDGLWARICRYGCL